MFSVRCVPKQLTSDEKACRSGLSVLQLTLYASHRQVFRAVHFYRVKKCFKSHETKITFTMWKQPSSPSSKWIQSNVFSKENDRNPLLGPQICNLFIIYFLEHDATLKTERYFAASIRRNMVELLCQCVIIFRDTAWLRVTTITCEWLRRCSWELMDHPLCSPLKGKRFATDADVKQAVTSWLRTIQSAVSYAVLETLMSQWDASLNVTGDNVLWSVPSATRMICRGWSQNNVHGIFIHVMNRIHTPVSTKDI